jgi:YidC/Oxa1 family membrane protein insertase
MDIQRLILFFVFSFSLLLLWEAWQKELRPPVVPAPTTQGGVPTPSAPAVSAQGAKTPTDAPPSAAPAGTKTGERLRVRTDTMLAEIDTQGGDLAYLELLKHKDTRDEKKNFVLFGPEHRYAAQSGLIGEGLPNHRTLFQAAGREFESGRGQDSLDVRLEASSANGVKVAKISFHRGSYRVDVRRSSTAAAPLSHMRTFS